MVGVPLDSAGRLHVMYFRTVLNRKRSAIAVSSEPVEVSKLKTTGKKTIPIPGPTPEIASRIVTAGEWNLNRPI